MATLHKLVFRPVFVVSGDGSQQQPFRSTDKGIVVVSSPLNNPQFVNNSYRYNLTGQHRCGDKDYRQFLDHIRNWVPAQNVLDDLQRGRVICEDGNIDASHIHHVMQMHPHITVLTFTNNAANTVNELVRKTLFAEHEPLAIVQMDCDLPPTPLYRGLHVTITQNRDKENYVVNGQLAVVHAVQNQTIFLRLPNDNVVPIYKVTEKRDGNHKTCYPIRMAYANTMCKAQGQTLNKVALWFDINNIPPGTAYVALSRVKRRDDIHFVTPLKTAFFTPVTSLIR